jgi:DNA-binding beta-propeller fold protein YncE
MVVVDADGHATVSTLAGKGKAGYRDGDGTQAKFSAPHALALGPDHKLYVADADNQRIRVVDLADPAHPVSTLAGSTKGFANGPAAIAQFASPGALAFDAHGDLLVGEIESFTIRKIAMADPAHPVTTAAGTGEWMDDDGPADQATMGHVTGLAAGPGGLMAFSDYSNGLVRLLRPDNQIAILAGSWLGGFREALWRSAGLHGPYGLAVDPGGTVYLAEGDDHRIWRITSLGDAAVLAGGGPAGNKQPEIPGAFADGPGPEARFNHPTGIAVDARGDLYVADAQNHRIRRIRRGS